MPRILLRSIGVCKIGRSLGCNAGGIIADLIEEEGALISRVK